MFTIRVREKPKMDGGKGMQRYRFSRKLTRTVQELAIRMRIPAPRVVLRAIALYRFLTDETKAGKRIYIDQSDGTRTEIVC